MHPKLTIERLAKTLVTVYPLPDDRIHFRLALWLQNFPVRNVRFVNGIKDMLVCSRNECLLRCAAEPEGLFDEFLFVDGDVIPDRRTTAFWDLDADVVCCKAEYPLAAQAWSTETAWHDPLWRCRATVLQRAPLPYFRWDLNGLGTKELSCICQGFAKRCREAGLTVGVSGECGHQMTQTWKTSGCRDAFWPVQNG